QRARGEPESVVDDLLRADEARRSAVARFEALRAEQKQLGKQMPTASGFEREALLGRTKELSQQVKDAETAASAAEANQRDAQLAVPNVIEEGAPPGVEDDFVVLREVGDRPRLAEPRDHLEIGEALRAIDVERGAKVSGSRFYYLTGVGALLQLGLLQLAMQQAVEYGVSPGPPAGAGQAGVDGGHRLSRRARERGVPARGGRPVPGRHVGGAARGLPRRRDPGARPAAPLRRLVVVLPPGGRLVRQGRA